MKQRRCPNCGSMNVEVKKLSFRRGLLTCLECDFFTEVELGVFE